MQSTQHTISYNLIHSLMHSLIHSSHTLSHALLSCTLSYTLSCTPLIHSLIHSLMHSSHALLSYTLSYILSCTPLIHSLIHTVRGIFWMKDMSNEFISLVFTKMQNTAFPPRECIQRDDMSVLQAGTVVVSGPDHMNVLLGSLSRFVSVRVMISLFACFGTHTPSPFQPPSTTQPPQ
jgi:hypothetical protein